MRIYLDTSVFNRPFDDQSQVKIFLEAQTFFLILDMIQNHQLELMSSAVLEYENSKNSDLERAKAVDFWLSIATYRQTITETIRSRAKEIEMFGVKPIDALHVACAEASQSDYFLTCDKRLINRCKHLNLKVINPIEFIMEIDHAS